MRLFSDFQTDHFMLIVGTNPLPNYVAAKLLSKETTQYHLLVSHKIKRLGIHKRLIHLLHGDPEDEAQYLTIEPSNPEDIKEKVSLCLSQGW